MQISSEHLEKLGLTQETVLQALSPVEFIESNFKNPDNLNEPICLEPGQKQAIHAMKFGYDIESTPDNYINKNPPRGVVMIWPRQTGKTTAVVLFACEEALVNPLTEIGILAQSQPLTKEIIKRIYNNLRVSGYKHRIARKTKMEIELENGSVIRGHATSESIRGFSYHYLIMDEAAQIDDDIIEAAAKHTTRKRGKRWVMLSTPKGYRGALVKYYKQGLKTRRIICKSCLTEFTQAHFENIKFDPMYMPPAMPPCPECGYQEEDLEEETRTIGQTYFYGMGDYTVISVDPFKCSFYPKEEIIEELDRQGWSDKARQELLGEIIPEGQAVFTQKMIDAATDATLKNIMKEEGKRYYIGIDFGKVHDNSVAAVIHEEDNKAVLDYIRVIQSEKGRSYEEIKDELIEIILYYDPVSIIPDSTGIGDPVMEEMERDLARAKWYGKIYSNKKNRLGFVFSHTSKPDLIDNVQQYFARNRILMPPSYEPDVDILVNELLNFSYEMTKSNYIKYGVQSEHDDTVIALALALWGLREKPWISPTASFALPRGKL